MEFILRRPTTKSKYKFIHILKKKTFVNFFNVSLRYSKTTSYNLLGVL